MIGGHFACFGLGGGTGEEAGVSMVEEGRGVWGKTRAFVEIRETHLYNNPHNKFNVLLCYNANC